MPEAYLAIDVEQQLGALRLQVRCAISAPWSILFGPSGAGKTSLLRLIAGLSTPERGQVLFAGQPLRARPAQRKIGFVTQRPALFPHMTVTENVSFGLSRLDRRSAQTRAAEMLELFDASQLATRLPDRLSGGEKQRVALARALAPEPRLLLLDEPFTGLDAGLKAGILTRLRPWLQQRGIPALYVSHDVTEALETAAEVILLEHGQVKDQGPASVVLAAQRKQLLLQLGASIPG